MNDNPIGAEVDPAPAQWPGAVTLQGRFCRLEKLDPERHTESLWQALRDDDGVWDYMAYGPFADGKAFAAWVVERAALKDPFAYAVTDSTGDGALGIITLMEIRPAMRVIEVGNILYSPLLQQTPAATEAQYLAARYAFDELRYRRYEWKCNALNAPSIKAAERFGFTYEGTFRQHMIVKGHNRDTAWFSIIDGEWPRIRTAFEAWLAPANFDRDGKQKKSLTQLRRSPPKT